MSKRPNKRAVHKYHYSVYFPENFANMMLEFVQTIKSDPDLTGHAANEMNEDKRGQIPLPTKEEILDRTNMVVEVHELVDKPGRIQRAAFRINFLSEDYDYTYIIARDGVIVTAWANDKGDNHRLTESRQKYIQGPDDLRLKNTAK